MTDRGTGKAKVKLPTMSAGDLELARVGLHHDGLSPGGRKTVDRLIEEIVRLSVLAAPAMSIDFRCEVCNKRLGDFGVAFCNDHDPRARHPEKGSPDGLA